MGALSRTADRIADKLLSRDAVENPELAFRAHWRIVGILGVALPFIVWAIGITAPDVGLMPRSSISDYYGHDRARDFFVGILWTVAWFLFAYKGYSRHDDAMTDLAGVLALAVSVVPNSDPVWGGFHLVCAAALLFILALMSLFVFTKTEEARDEPLLERIRSVLSSRHPRPTAEAKKRRNRVYKASGWVILASLAGAALTRFVLDPEGVYPGIFLFEALALIAFGVGWLTKGGTFPWLNDPPSALGDAQQRQDARRDLADIG
jgi:hypothetical protein